MTKEKKLTNKQFNHLLSLGTLMLSNAGLIDLTNRLREKYKINLTENEWNPEYMEKLENSGTKDAIRDEIEDYLVKFSEENKSNNFIDKIISLLEFHGDQKIKDVWNQYEPLILAFIKDYLNKNGEKTVNQLLKKHNLDIAQGKIFVDGITDFIITDELQAVPPGYIDAVITQIPDTVITLSTPLTIQEHILDEHKEVMRDKFPFSSRSIDDRIAAACLAYRNMGLSNEKIALKLYNVNPNSGNFKAELKRKANLVSKKIEKINKIIEQRL